MVRFRFMPSPSEGPSVPHRTRRLASSLAAFLMAPLSLASVMLRLPQSQPFARCKARTRTLLGFLSLLSFTGCGEAFHIKQIKSGNVAPYYVHELASHWRDERATELLIQVMAGDPDPAARYFAAAALYPHIYRSRHDQLRMRALLALAWALDDRRIGMTSWPVLGPLLPGVSGYTGSVRVQALLTLTRILMADHGFDRSAWEALIKERFGTIDSTNMSAAESYRWRLNYEEARRDATDEGRELLLVFPTTYSSTRKYLRTLYEPRVAALFAKSVNCMLDTGFPPGRREELNLTKSLANMYQVTEWPALVLVLPGGDHRTLCGFQTPNQIIEFVMKARDARAQKRKRLAK